MLSRLTLRSGLRLAAVTIALAASARAAAAQTVIVRSTPPSSSIELSLDGGTPITATSNADGDATLTVPARTAESDVQIHVDSCGTLTRVVLVTRGLQTPPTPPGCTRTDFPSVFIMHPVTTFVVDVNSPDTSVHVSQGPPPEEWIHRGPESARHSTIFKGEPLKGVVLGAGVGFSSFSDATTVFCGNASTCDTGGGGAVALGADVWLTRLLAAHVGYLKPSDFTASGKESTSSFDSHLQTRILTIGGKLGGAAGSTRIYGGGGLSHTEATSTIAQTINDQTITVNGVTQVVKGGTQSFGEKSTGWSWYAGGGVEAWINRWVALYGEVSFVNLKGTPEGGGTGGIDDRAIDVLVGVRARIGR